VKKVKSKIVQDDVLGTLIKISNKVGVDPNLVQGGGGNTSVKTEDGKYMYIKASGTALKDMNAEKGWRRVCVDDLIALVNDAKLANLEMVKRETQVVARLDFCCDDHFGSGFRPSVEAPLHAILDSCVIHLHPNAVGAFVNSKDGQKKIDKLFADYKCPPLWVPYVDPGFTLSRTVFKLVQQYQTQYGKMPAIVFLEKHGLFVSAKKPAEALNIVKDVIDRCSQKLKSLNITPAAQCDKQAVRSASLTIRKAVYNATGQYFPVSFSNNSLIKQFSNRSDAAKLLNGAITPDELVYANGPAVYLEKVDAKKITAKLTAQIEKGEKVSRSFLVKDLGLFIAADSSTTPVIEQVCCSSLFIRSNAAGMGGLTTLSKRQADFINNWEAEAFRQKQYAGSSSADLKNRVAVVTGAGSGLGRSIAIGLANSGAIVALADIDVEAAQKTAETIKAQLPHVSVMAIKCNVTNEADVESGFAAILDCWGGVDIIVNAAGIAPAYALVDLPVDKWRLALEINLTGYFIMAKIASRIMIAQGIGGSIVNLSSKSGIDASKNNTPYNATKSGELHMARGWAMELGQSGIRVNCVCPGNVFEGSKIWNPEYIKVCAKKYGIKPEEVIPYYVDKTMLKREIKGSDIANAVVFLCSEKSRMVTGQTLVVDAGQAMVR
jgi:NAD(P)-dependent dehydrogenase (short-subunit alcohol dehydrogenase family)/rhamnose utilization protein RhaD (predicted bifunctional aldolase and dehydrogenase)